MQINKLLKMHFVESPCNLALYPNKLAQKKKMIFVNSKKHAVIYEKIPYQNASALVTFFSPLSVHKKRKERKMRCRFSLKFLKIQSDEMDNFLKSKFFSGEKGIL